MYGEIDRRGAHLTLDVQEMVRALERGDLAAVCALVGNVFEQVIDPESDIFTIRPSAHGARRGRRVYERLRLGSLRPVHKGGDGASGAGIALAGLSPHIFRKNGIKTGKHRPQCRQIRKEIYIVDGVFYD